MRSILTFVVRLALVACALGCVAACTRPPAPPVEGSQVPKPAVEFLPRALEAVPEGQPVVAVLRAEKLRALRGQLTELAGIEPPVQALHPWVGLVTLEGRANAYAFPLDLEGLRPGEPVVWSMAYGSDEAASLLSRGADPGIWARVLLPVEDEPKARAALERWMEGMRLQPLAQPADRSVWAGPGQLVRVSSEPSVGLAVDWMVQHPDAPAGAAPPALGWLERAGAKRVGTSRAQAPAWRRLLEGSGAAEVYVDVARLPDALLRVDLQDLGRISASAPSHEQGALWSRAWSLLLRDVRAMGSLDRQSEAVTLSWEGGPAPTVGLTRGLTPRAQAAQRAGREGAGAVYGPALADPIVWLQVRQDVRGWWEALGQRAWLQGEPEPTESAFASLWESRNARLYHLLQGPLTAAMDAGGVSAQWLPQGGTLVVQDVDFSPQGGLLVSAGLVAQYPAGGLPGPLRGKVDELLADLKTSDPTGSVQVEVLEDQGGTQLRVGLRQKAEALLRLDAPITEGPEVSLRVRFQRLRKVAAVLWPGLPEGLLKLQGLELAGRSEGGVERVGLRLDLGAQAPLLDLGTASAQEGAPPAAPSGDEGRRCLLGWERALAERLELWPDVPRARQAAFLREMDRAGGAELSCLARDPKTSDQARRLEEAWGAWRFEAKRDLGLPEALAEAQAACKQGYAWGCEGAKGLALPFGAGALRVPRVAWPQDAFPEVAAGTLYATQEGVFVPGSSAPLASLAELSAPDAQGRLPWVAQRLPKPEHPINRALHVFADQGLPVGALWALLRSAEEEGWRPRVMLEDLGGGPRAVDVVFRPTEPLWAFEGGEHVPPPHAAWVGWGPGGVTLRAEGKSLGAWPLAQGEAGRLGLAKAAHGLYGRLGRAPLYHIYIEGSPSWGELAAWMPGLLGTDKAPTAWGAHAERVSGLRGWGEARRPTLVLQAQEPKGRSARVEPSPDPAPLPSALTDEVLGRASTALEGCFQAHPTPSPVRLRLLVVVPPDGTPKHAQATGGRALEDGALRGCVEEVARAWRFPINQTDTYVERALVFFQEGGAP